MKNLFITLFFTLGLVTLFASCQQQDEEIIEKQEEGRLLFSMNAPSNGLLTRAEEADATIETLYALYFIEASDGYFKYKDFEVLKNSSINKLVKTDAGTVNSTYTYRILSGNDNSSNSYDSWFGASGSRTNLDMKIVFVANATITTGTLTANTELSAALSTLIVANATTVSNSSSTAPIYVMEGTSVWPSGKNIPMYTVTDEVVIPYGPYIKDHYVGQSATSTGAAGVYNLIRMLAKIKIDNTINIKDVSGNTNPYNFEITKISVVNGLNKGYLPYMPGVNVVWDETNKRVSEVKTIPTATSFFAPDNGVAPTITTTSGVQSVTFYLFETNKILAEKTEAREEAKNKGYCYLKLEGYRWAKAESKPSSPATVEYMLPIPLVTETTGSLTASANYAGDVLRNHYYNFTIAGVNLFELKAKIKVQEWSTVGGMNNVTPIPLP
ncbi:hypothetical protein [Bacteroides sp. 224]|uniref:hypothetical protein n=1 Tax=Bacteroides sp. 224 TaxID=2302936 RepID=UPI0013D2526D|nr:hypothetical protein [Bacteroides sp. 224]NDV67142.1 hypothetical protein [Bacteroides sp. 224]